MSGVKAAIRYGLFPLNFVAALAVAYMAVGTGWNPELVLISIAVVTATTIMIAERISPFHAVWNQSQNDIGTDAIHVVISQAVVPKVIEFGLFALLVGGASAVAEQSAGGWWPADLNLFLQLALALVLTQFPEYWWHRLCHEHPFFWRLHATHHSPGRLYWLNAGRFHPLDTAASAFVSLAVLVGLGAGVEVVLMLSTWIVVHGMYQHCNVDLRLGPLNYIFSMAELHRWHHSLTIEEANSNYGNNIIFWDLVFGTMFWPKDRRPSEYIGLAEMPDFPQGYMGQLASPFQWQEILDRQPKQE